MQSAGYTNIDFVGTQTGATCNLPFDSDGEGHGGIQATDIANLNQLPPWLAATNPDIVLMHLGTNDILNGTKTTAMILAAYSTMVDQMRANNPNIKIIVAQIIPMYTSTTQCTVCYQHVIDLNAAIPSWAAGKTTAQSPITIVDQWTGFDTTTDTAEGIHPNDAGNQKMSDKWYPALAAVLSGTQLPTSTITRTPTATTVLANTSTATQTRTVTPGITTTATKTNTPSRTPTNGLTATRTRTPIVGTVTSTPTRTNTPLPVTATPTSGAGACSPVTSTITAPFAFDGAGTFCWQSSNLGSYVNSWNTTSVTINGVNESNLYVAAGSLPAKIGGFWYVAYNSSVAWGHFEAK